MTFIPAPGTISTTLEEFRGRHPASYAIGEIESAIRIPVPAGVAVGDRLRFRLLGATVVGTVVAIGTQWAEVKSFEEAAQ